MASPVAASAVMNGGIRLKTRLRFASLLLAGMLVLSTVALADSPWNVLSFLSVADKPEAAALMQPVNGSATDGQVSIAINGAFI